MKLLLPMVVIGSLTMPAALLGNSATVTVSEGPFPTLEGTHEAISTLPSDISWMSGTLRRNSETPDSCHGNVPSSHATCTTYAPQWCPEGESEATFTGTTNATIGGAPYAEIEGGTIDCGGGGRGEPTPH